MTRSLLLFVAFGLAGGLLAVSASGCGASARANDDPSEAAAEIGLRAAHLAHQELLRRLPEGYVCYVQGFDVAPKRFGLEPVLHEPGVCVWIVTPESDSGLAEIMVELRLVPSETVEEPLFVVESFGVRVESAAETTEAAEVLRRLRR